MRSTLYKKFLFPDDLLFRLKLTVKKKKDLVNLLINCNQTKKYIVVIGYLRAKINWSKVTPIAGKNRLQMCPLSFHWSDIFNS